MTALLAILISGVLLDANNKPIPQHHLTVIAADGWLIDALTTDNKGRFKVELSPGTYRLQIGFDGTMESITVNKSISKLKLVKRTHISEPHVIPIIQGTPRRPRI